MKLLLRSGSGDYGVKRSEGNINFLRSGYANPYKRLVDSSTGTALTPSEPLGTVDRAFFDIFSLQDFSTPPYIGHLRGKVTKSGGSYEGSVDLISDGITQSSLKEPSPGPGLTDADLERYYFSSYANGLVSPHLIYSLDFPNCEVSGPDDVDGKWTVRFYGTPVEVSVSRLPRKGKKPLPSNPRPEDYTERVLLGTCAADLSFEYKTKHHSDMPNEVNGAPGKYQRLSTLWGDIKSQ